MKTVNYMQPGASMNGYATVPATSDAKEYLRLLLRHKLGLLLTLLLGVGLATLYLISKSPTYEAHSLLEVSDTGFVGGDSQRDPWNSPTIKEESNILKSRRVLQPVVDVHNLRTAIAPNKLPVLGDVTRRIPAVADWLSGLDFAKHYSWHYDEIEVSTFQVPREWEDQAMTLVALGDNRYTLLRDGATVIDSAAVGERLLVELPPLEPLQLQVTGISAAEGTQFSLTRYSLQSTINELSSNLTVETSDAKSRMLNIKLRGEDPRQTADLLNAIAQEYRDVKLDGETRESRKEYEFVRDSLPKVEAELRAAEAATANLRSRVGANNQTVQLNLLLNQISILETKLSELEIENDQLSQRYSIDHPDIKRLTKDINAVQRELNSKRARANRAPAIDQQLTQLQNEEDIARKQYEETKGRLITLEQNQQAFVPQVKLWDKALTPRKPVSPNALLAMVGGTLATMFLYMLYLTLRSALSTVISDQDSLERASGLPVFMNVPKSSAQRRLGNAVTVDPRRLLPGSSGSSNSKALAPADSNVLALSKPDDYSIENLRGLRSMLEDVMDGAENNVLMITSPLPSMGKSFVSMNLAVLLAQAGKRVLLIDSDYQRGQLHKQLGLQMGPGLPEVVRGKSELKETVKPTSVQNLYCIPRGFMGASVGMEMPSDKEFGAFLQVVAPRFDIVIIDTPPVLSVATAAALGKHAGSSIMVIKEGEVKEPQLTEALKRLSFSGVRVNGCILNGASTPTPRHYAYYREQID